MLLSACSKTNISLSKHKLPVFSMGDEKVGKEFDAICDDVKCKEIYIWLYALHEFDRDYNIYKEELAK